jgi:hypothetical protein
MKGLVVFELILVVILCCLTVFGVCLFFGTPAIEARLYNEKFNKHYSAWDFMLAGSTIKEFLNGGKQDTHNYKIEGAIPIKIQPPESEP